jgi:hypothetical protein
MGEPQSGIDPVVSEWGNPSAVMGRDPPRWEVSGGTETSQYPEEAKRVP